MQITRNPAAKRRAVRPSTPPSLTPVKRRKAGFRPFLRAAAGQARLLKGETLFDQTMRCIALVFVLGLLSIAGVRIAQETKYQAGLLVAVNKECSQPRPLSHVSACKDFTCLASINEDNARYVRICHPEALS